MTKTNKAQQLCAQESAGARRVAVALCQLSSRPGHPIVRHETRQLSRAAIRSHMSYSHTASPPSLASPKPMAASTHTTRHHPSTPHCRWATRGIWSHTSVTQPTKQSVGNAGRLRRKSSEACVRGAHETVQKSAHFFFGVLSLSFASFASFHLPHPRHACVRPSHPIPASRNPAPNPLILSPNRSPTGMMTPSPSSPPTLHRSETDLV